MRGCAGLGEGWLEKMLCAGGGSRLVEVGPSGASPDAAPGAGETGPPPGPMANYQVKQIQGPSRPPASPVSTSSAPGPFSLHCTGNCRDRFNQLQSQATNRAVLDCDVSKGSPRGITA